LRRVLGVDRLAIRLGMVKLGDQRLHLLALRFQGADSLTDDRGVNTGLDRRELAAAFSSHTLR
jgi:hypothetical protein